jgi:serine/threonine protein kinase
MSTETINELREWIERTYDNCIVHNEPETGTYGIVWFLKAKSHSHEFAIKTIDPKYLINPDQDRNVDNLKREFAIWMTIPHCYNVVSALHIKFANYYSSVLGAQIRGLPVMQMPKSDGSLDKWIQDDSISIENRLLAIAAGLNGLLHIYNNGFEGHGDLKPSNLLYENLTKKFRFEKEKSESKRWPTIDYPWLIKIADFGWSDIWRDLGLTGKALREYLAPERLDGEFKAKNSDMFAMGVIAYELLTGKHPARNLKKAKKSEGNWRRCCQSEDWELGSLPQGRLFDVIKAALSFEHSLRPTPEKFLQEVCDELEENYGFEGISYVLEYYRNHSSDLDGIKQLCWAAQNASKLGELERNRSLRKLETAIDHLNVDDLNACEKWGLLANTAIHLQNHLGSRASKSKIRSLRERADKLLSSHFAEVDSKTLQSLEERTDCEILRPYELLSGIVEQLALASKTSYEVEKGTSERLAPLALSALAFSEAQKSRSNKERCEYLLSEAIRHSPQQPEPYYFRAFWTEEWLLMFKVKKIYDNSLIQELVNRSRSDLKIASGLAPTWKEVDSEISRFETVLDVCNFS